MGAENRSPGLPTESKTSEIDWRGIAESRERLIVYLETDFQSFIRRSRKLIWRWFWVGIFVGAGLVLFVSSFLRSDVRKLTETEKRFYESVELRTGV